MALTGFMHLCLTSNIYLGLDGGLEGNCHVLMEQGDYSPTYPSQIAHTSLLCTVFDREIWVSVKFTKNFPKILNTMKDNINVIEWIGTIPTKYQPLWEDSDGKSPSFLQYLPPGMQGGAYH